MRVCITPNARSCCIGINYMCVTIIKGWSMCVSWRSTRNGPGLVTKKLCRKRYKTIPSQHSNILFAFLYAVFTCIRSIRFVYQQLSYYKTVSIYKSMYHLLFPFIMSHWNQNAKNLTFAAFEHTICLSKTFLYDVSIYMRSSVYRQPSFVVCCFFAYVFVFFFGGV